MTSSRPNLLYYDWIRVGFVLNNSKIISPSFGQGKRPNFGCKWMLAEFFFKLKIDILLLSKYIELIHTPCWPSWKQIELHVYSNCVTDDPGIFCRELYRACILRGISLMRDWKFPIGIAAHSFVRHYSYGWGILKLKSIKILLLVMEIQPFKHRNFPQEKYSILKINLVFIPKKEKNSSYTCMKW